MNNDSISREALKATIIEPLNVNDAGKNDWYDGYYTAKNEDVTYINNATPFEPEITEKQAILLLINSGWLVNHDKELREKWERPQGDCENCDFRKFSEKFVDGVVEVMNKNGITSVEQLSEILKGGAE